MKINAETIDRCALEAIADQVGNPWEYCKAGEDEADGMRLVALGAVNGIYELANRLKEVLENEL